MSCASNTTSLKSCRTLNILAIYLSANFAIATCSQVANFLRDGNAIILKIALQSRVKNCSCSHSLRNYDKLSSKFLSGTSTVIEKVGLLSFFLSLARATIGIRVNTLYVHCMFTICSLFLHYISTVSRRWDFCRIFLFLARTAIGIHLNDSLDKIIW